MTKRRTIPALLAAVTIGLGVTGAAHAADPTAADMQAQIEALRAKVEQLEQKKAAEPAYTQADVETAVDSVLRDADRRTNLLAETGAFYGGYVDDKFTIRSADGNFSLSPTVHFQFRYATNWRDQQKSQGTDNTQSGFEVRRLKFGLEGHAFSKAISYGFVWATNRADSTTTIGGENGTVATGGSLILEEAWVKYQFADQFAVRAGTVKQFVYVETMGSSKRLLGVERSLVAEALFGGDAYSQAVQLEYDNGKDGNLQALVGFSDGYQSRNTDFRDPGTNPFDFGVYSRVNFKVFGDWKSYNDPSALGNKKDLLVIGAGFDWSQNGDQDVVRWAADAQFETGAFSATAAVTGRYASANGSEDVHDLGFLAQLGYLVNPQWEVFGRWSMLALDSSGTSGETEFCELTAGLNYYLRGHSAKVQCDVGWLPNGSPANFTSADILSGAGEDQVYVRVQFQLLL